MAAVVLNMTTWNRLQYSIKAIDAILSQTFEDWQLNIVDNFSWDGTQEYLKTLTDPRITITLWPENRGLSAATNQSWIGHNSKYCGRIDNDACVERNWLERLVNAHEAYDNFGVLAGMHFTQKHLKYLEPNIEEFNGIKVWRKKYTGGCAFLMKRSDYDKFGEIPGKRMFQGNVLGFSDYQVKFSDAGLINGYLFPFSWVNHLEHPDSQGHISNEEYNNYSTRVRGVGCLDYGVVFDRDSKPYLEENTL